MKITLEPSVNAQNWNLPQHKVVIDYPSDEVSLSEMLELLANALRAYGFNVGELQEVEEL
jgi:hypothetical protein